MAKAKAATAKKKGGKHGFWRRHSLSIMAIAILLLWIALYRAASTQSHLGAFFGNAVADWTGVVVMVLATKYLYEKGSAESRQPPHPFFAPVWEKLRDHSLSIFLVITGAGWAWIYASSDVQDKWNQVVGNIVSEWTQLLGLVWMTKKLIETHSKESHR
jgi:hypothetical protein